jgi:oxalate decarboxylase/phosphoglucose isomerase-like protein (cupin superfamily)
MLEKIISRFNPATGEIAGARTEKRRLSDLRGCFADPDAYEAALAADDPLVYTVTRVTPADGDGDCITARAASCPEKSAANIL